MQVRHADAPCRRAEPWPNTFFPLQLGVEGPSVTQLAEHLLMLSTLACATEVPKQTAAETSGGDGDLTQPRSFFRRSVTPTPVDGEDQSSPDSPGDHCRTPEQGPETLLPVSRLAVSSLASETTTIAAKNGPRFSTLALALPSHTSAAALYASLVMHVGHAPGLLSLVAGVAQCDPAYILSLAQVRRAMGNTVELLVTF